MVMDRETSHCHACTSNRFDCPIFRKFTNHTLIEHVSPRTTRIQRNLVELSYQDLFQLTKQLKYPGITTLRLSARPEDQLSILQRFGRADQKSTNTISLFLRALAYAIEGWMENLELGMYLGLRDINTLCPAIRSITTLRHLSFANNQLGDVTLQVLSLYLQHCQSLQTLNLSGCALTDVSTSIITAIIKGEDLNAQSMLHNTQKTLLAKHRVPKYGQQWRQNVILIGKWSPVSNPKDNLITEIAKMDWQTTLRKPLIVGNNCHRSGIKHITTGLIGLDLSYNSFTDALFKDLCPLLYKKPPLCALNLRCNQITRAGAKSLLDIMKELHILRLVDIRDNIDGDLLGVLENGEHYTTFSTYQSPFWMDPESLDPVICNFKKSRSNTPINCSKFTSSSRLNILDKQSKATMASQKATISRDRITRSHSMSPQNSSNKIHTSGLRNKIPSKRSKIPLKTNNNNHQSNISPSSSEKSISKTPADDWRPNGRYKRYHCSCQESLCQHHENKDMSILNDLNRRCILAPGKERPTSNSTRVSSQRSVWLVKTTFVDQINQRHVSSSRDKDVNTRLVSHVILEPPCEHSIWDNTTMHKFDMKDMHGSSKAFDGLGQRHVLYEGYRRAQSARYNLHHPNYSRDYNNHQDFNRNYGHQNYYKNFSASQSPSRSPWPLTIYNQKRGDSQRKRSQKKSPIICCHHRCKLLNEVQEQKQNRTQVAEATWLEEHEHMPSLHLLMPKVDSLPDDKKELVEWNNFVNQMTNTLLNLKDGLDQLISPSEEIIAQQTTTKVNQMPSSFFKSGMLRLLERSCKVLNTHVTSLTKRHKEKSRHNSENLAPIVNGELPNKKKISKVTINQGVVVQQKKQFHKSKKTLQNEKELGVHHNNQEHQMIYHPNLSPLTTSKGTNIP